VDFNFSLTGNLQTGVRLLRKGDLDAPTPLRNDEDVEQRGSSGSDAYFI
jgi:hypothetical protein